MAPPRGAAPATARTRTRTTTPGSSSRPARPARPRASRSPTATPRRSSTPRPRLFLQDEPLGPGDRVMAGLSVAFDASLRGDVARLAVRRVPGARAPRPGPQRHRPRSVAGRQRGHASSRPSRPWSRCGRTRRWTRVRLLILGGEACPPELAPGWCRPGREVWNTYGPTEATVVACGARLTDGGSGADRPAARRLGPRRRRRRRASRSRPGRAGELIIGGVGLARYLDPAKDAEKYAADADPRLGPRLPQRRPRGATTRTGCCSAAAPTTRSSSAAAGSSSARSTARCSGCPAWSARRPPCAAPTPATSSWWATSPSTTEFDATAPMAAAAQRHARRAGASAGPGRDDPHPDLGQGRPRRAALAAARGGAPAGPRRWTGRQAWIADALARGPRRRPCTARDGRLLRPRRRQPDRRPARLAAARAASPRSRSATSTTTRRSAAWPTTSTALAAGATTCTTGRCRPTPLKTQAGQVVAIRSCCGLTAPALAHLAAAVAQRGRGQVYGARRGCPTVSVVGVLARLARASSRPPGRMLLAAAGARLLLRGLGPGDHPRGGKVHLRLWAAERLVDQLGAASLAGAPWMTVVRPAARRAGRAATSTCTRVPPVTGLLRLGDGCSIEPEVDLTGYWVDGDVLHLGEVRVGRGAGSGTRSMLVPGRRGRRRRRGGARVGRLRRRCRTASSGRARRPSGSAARPVDRGRTGRRASRAWVAAYAAAALLLSLLPAAAVAVGVARWPLVAGRPSRRRTARRRCVALLPWLFPATRGRPGWCWRCWCWSWSGSRRRAAARRPSRPQPGRARRSGRRCGCWTRPAPGCSRCTPRSSPRPGCGCSAPGSATTSRPPPC